MLRALTLASCVLCAVPAAASAFERISDRNAFMEVVGGKDLRMAMYGLTLNVKGDGSIAGRAAGWDIRGSWVWEDGYFCRGMDWSGYPIEYNCQLVEVREDRIRFTVDQGAGDNAVLRIR